MSDAPAPADIPEPQLVELHHDTSGTTIVMKHPIVHVMAEHLAAAFTAAGGANYVTFEIDTEELGPMMLTMQRRWGETPERQARERLARIGELDAEITRLRSLLPPHAPVTPGTIAIPEDMLWSVSRHLRTFGLFVASSEMRAEIEADREAVFGLLTEKQDA